MFGRSYERLSSGEDEGAMAQAG